MKPATTVLIVWLSFHLWVPVLYASGTLWGGAGCCDRSAFGSAQVESVVFGSILAVAGALALWTIAYLALVARLRSVWGWVSVVVGLCAALAAQVFLLLWVKVSVWPWGI